MFFDNPTSILCYTILMVKKQKRRRTVKEVLGEPDSIYFLKLVIYILLGVFWIKFHAPISLGPFIFNGFPIGLFIGLYLASRDRFQIDRKIEYAILIIFTLLSYFLPVGIVI